MLGTRKNDSVLIKVDPAYKTFGSQESGAPNRTVPVKRQASPMELTLPVTINNPMSAWSKL